jgi:hypothetical protein
MKISLNEIVSLIASRVGQPFNADLLEELKFIVNYKRAAFFKRSLEKHPEQRRYFYKDFSVPLVVVDKATCPFTVSCDVLRSQYPVPLPIRSSEEFFDFVGSIEKSQPFGYATPEDADIFKKYNRYTSTSAKYFYTNGYLYIYNFEDLAAVNVRGIFPDPRQLSVFKCGDKPCYTDDDQYEIPSDLVNDIVVDVLRTELQALIPKEGEVDIDKSDKKVEQGGPTNQ